MSNGNSRLAINKDTREVSSRFAVAIRTARERKKLSLDKLGKLTATSASYINRLETYQRRNPSLTVFFSLADHLDINVWQLLKIALNENEKAPDVVDLIINEDFTIDGKLIDSPEFRKTLMDLLLMIIYQVDEGISFQEVLPLIELIQKFHVEKKMALAVKGA